MHEKMRNDLIMRVGIVLVTLLVIASVYLFEQQSATPVLSVQTEFAAHSAAPIGDDQ